MLNNKQVRIEISDGAAIPDPWDKRLINAWSISLVFAVGLLVFLCTATFSLTIPNPFTGKEFTWVMNSEVYADAVRLLPPGLEVTFSVTFLSICITIPLGVLVGLGRLSPIRIVNLFVSTYVEVIRGIPLLVQLFFIFYSLSEIFNVPSLVAAVIALSFCYGAYMGEVFRAGISSIDKGQTEAALSLGFNKIQTMRYIVLPQALRTILPPVGNECIALLKDTSLVSIVGVADIFRIAREHVSVTYTYFETYLVVALVYLIITLILSKCVSLMEARLSYHVRS